MTWCPLCTGSNSGGPDAEGKRVQGGYRQGQAGKPTQEEGRTDCQGETGTQVAGLGWFTWEVEEPGVV